MRMESIFAAFFSFAVLIFDCLSFTSLVMEFFIAASPEHQRREKHKARELRATQWWKNQLGRGLCHHCGQRFHPSELTMDHLLPIARGGHSTKGNVVPSCKPCNTQKGHKTAIDQAFEELKSRDLAQNSPYLVGDSVSSGTPGPSGEATGDGAATEVNDTTSIS